MRVTPAEPAAGPETPATGEGLLRAHAARLRLALLAGGSALVLLAIALIAGELAALRVPIAGSILTATCSQPHVL